MRNREILSVIVGVLLVIFGAIDGFANGGDQRVVEGKYLINLARAPFTPRAGEKVSMLISFADLKTNQLIQGDLAVNIRIAKLGGAGAAKREFLSQQAGIKVMGGVLEFPYTFPETGLHEVFIDFAVASNPGKIYEAPDFLLDVQKPSARDRLSLFVLIGVAAGLLVGFLLGWRFVKI